MDAGGRPNGAVWRGSARSGPPNGIPTSAVPRQVSITRPCKYFEPTEQRQQMYVPRLYRLCVEAVVRLLERAGDSVDWDWDGPAAADAAGHALRGLSEWLRCAALLPGLSLGARLCEELQLRALGVASGGLLPGTGDGAATCWRDAWLIFLTRRSETAVVAWQRDLLKMSVRQLLVSQWKPGTALETLLQWTPSSVSTVDLDGELAMRGRRPLLLDHLQAQAQAQTGLHVWRRRPPPREPRPQAGGATLSELHLGAARATLEDLQALLQGLPALRLLRHYQLVRALHALHAEQARRGDRLPQYRLTNLDVDFSHVTRCRWSAEAVLSRDALPLAVRLCPEAESVRVRCDSDTPHDALESLVRLRRMRELSVACVTSGERSLLDFQDLLPLLDAHGQRHLVSLELKVMENVDTHEITARCPRLERLLLSGCGTAFPHACAQHGCLTRPRWMLPRLRTLFFADGDDFSWDHALPPCFWDAALAAGDGGPQSRVEGVFLESPRLPAERLSRLLRRAGGWPQLRVLSACRAPELRLQPLQAACRAAPRLAYLRVSACDALPPTPDTAAQLRQHLPPDAALCLD
ncbi:uncharacterized protein LOC126154162 [Schistocerca cancellata]|uniref:uncharacterized protein LOC126154162 n=1 Tax=Schistocerca cancellata TaxID=274614 RepID=UPI0021191D22|nr:uncharacterized protein LOC126154162 [Schistocerca cancellata]